MRIRWRGPGYYLAQYWDTPEVLRMVGRWKSVATCHLGGGVVIEDRLVRPNSHTDQVLTAVTVLWCRLKRVDV